MKTTIDVANLHREIYIDAVALDKVASNRWTDPTSGYMHVKDNLLTQAEVSPYYGREIQGGQAAGLNPDEIYNVFRPLDELQAALPTLCGGCKSAKAVS